MEEKGNLEGITKEINEGKNEGKIAKNDFVELEFIGRIKDEGVFDTNIPKEAEKAGLKQGKKEEEQPMVVCVGQGMLVKGFDNALEAKEIGKMYRVELQPRDAFGERQRELVKIMPLRIFLEKEINPQVGQVFVFDNMLGRISSVSGGRVMVDFNNPLAGKIVVYDFKIKKKVKSMNEKIDALMDFFFKKRFEFSVSGRSLIIKVGREFENVINMFKDRFKDILGLSIVVKTKEKKEKGCEIKREGKKQGKKEESEEEKEEGKSRKRK